MGSTTEVPSEKPPRKRSQSLQGCRVDVVKKARTSADEAKRPFIDEAENINPQGKYGVSFAFVL